MNPSSSKIDIANRPTTGKNCGWMKALSELACRRAYLAAIPCEIMASLKTTRSIYCPAPGYSTYPEKHPTTSKNHLFNGIWLVGQPAILALKVFQGYRDIFRSILERLDDRKFSDYGILRYMASVDCPWLSKVREVSKLCSEFRSRCGRR